MKRVITLIIFISCIHFLGFSQIEKKTFLLGGNSNLVFNLEDNFYLNINPNTGRFISDNFCLGLSLDIILFNNTSYYGVSPYARYYLKSKESKSLFFSSSLGLTSFLDNINSLDPGFLSLGAGHTWLLNKSIGFETSFVGNTNLDEIRFGMYFGFQIYFKRDDN